MVEVREAHRPKKNERKSALLNWKCRNLSAAQRARGPFSPMAPSGQIYRPSVGA